MFAPAAHGYAAAAGRYAGTKAAAYASQASRPAISREPIVREKNRVYAPIKRKESCPMPIGAISRKITKRTIETTEASTLHSESRTEDRYRYH